MSNFAYMVWGRKVAESGVLQNARPTQASRLLTTVKKGALDCCSGAGSSVLVGSIRV